MKGNKALCLPLYMPPTGIPGHAPDCLIRVLTAVYGLVTAPTVWRKTVRVSSTPASTTSSPTMQSWRLGQSFKWLESFCLMWMTFVKEEENGINGS